MKKLIETLFMSPLFVEIDLKQYDTTTQVTTANSTDNDLSPEMKTFYDTTLLDNAEPKLVHSQFGQKVNIPQNHGKTIEFRKFASLAPAMTALTEGVTPDGHNLDVSSITSTLAQHGAWVRMSDTLELTSIDNMLVNSAKVLGAQMGKTQDNIVRNILAAGTNVMYSAKTVSGALTEVTARTGLDMTATLSVDDILKASTLLQAQDAEPIGDSFVAIIHPYVAYDIMKSSDFVDWHKYATPENLYQGEIGKIGNVRFVTTTQAKVWKDSTCASYTESSTTKYYGTFATLVIAENAYATTTLEGAGSEMIVKQRGQGDDPIDQRSTAGWKCYLTAEILNNAYMVRIESCSSYSKVVSAN